MELGHRVPQPARVLLGDDDRQVQRAGALDQDRGAVDDGVEPVDRRAEGLLHVDHHERRARGVERLVAGRQAHADTPGSGAAVTAKPRSRKATAPPATVSSTRPRTVRPAKQQFAERLS